MDNSDSIPVWWCPRGALSLEFPLHITGGYYAGEFILNEVAKRFNTINRNAIRRFGVFTGDHFSLIIRPNNVPVTPKSTYCVHRNTTISITSISLIRLKLVFRNKKEIIEVVPKGQQMGIGYSRLEALIRAEYGISKPNLKIFVGRTRFHPGQLIVTSDEERNGNTIPTLRVSIDATAYSPIPDINDESLIGLENGVNEFDKELAS